MVREEVRIERARGRAGMAGLVVIVAAATLLAACSSPRPRAPVSHRDTQAGQPVAVISPPGKVVMPPPPSASQPPVPAAPAAAASGAAVSAPAPVAKVETAPVRSGRIESRPLSASALGASVKTEPSAAKQPYSERLFARMQASQAQLVPPPATSAPPAAQQAVTPPTPAPADQTASAKQAPATAAKADPRAAPDLPAGGFHWPSSGRIIENFSEPRSSGLVFDGKPGDPVLAAADGKVIFSGLGPRGYGNLIIIKHVGDLLTVYAHNRKLLVKEGQQVRRDQPVAELGDSGTDKPKLHFEIRRQGRPIDPLALLPPR